MKDLNTQLDSGLKWKNQRKFEIAILWKEFEPSIERKQNEIAFTLGNP